MIITLFGPVLNYKYAFKTERKEVENVYWSNKPLLLSFLTLDTLGPFLNLSLWTFKVIQSRSPVYGNTWHITGKKVNNDSMQAQLSSQRCGCFDLVKWVFMCVCAKSKWWWCRGLRSPRTLSTIWPLTSSIRILGCSQHKPMTSLLRAVHSKHLPTPTFDLSICVLAAWGYSMAGLVQLSVYRVESMGIVSFCEKLDEDLARCPFGTIPVPSGEAEPHQRRLRCLLCCSPFPCNTFPIECIS